MIPRQDAAGSICGSWLGAAEAATDGAHAAYPAEEHHAPPQAAAGTARSSWHGRQTKEEAARLSPGGFPKCSKNIGTLYPEGLNKVS